MKGLNQKLNNSLPANFEFENIVIEFCFYMFTCFFKTKLKF